MAAFSVVMPPVSGVVLLGTLHKVGPWLRAQEELGLLAYVGAFTVLGGLALLPTYAPSLLAGWAFGRLGGVGAALSGFLGAALVSYAVSRRVSAARVDAMLADAPRWHAVRGALVHSGFWKAVLIVTLLRLPPNAPFAASNLAMAALRVPLGPYVLGTLAGLAPRTSAVVLLGAGLSVLDFSNRRQAGWFLAGLLVTIAVLASVGWLARRTLADIEARGASGHAGPAEPVNHRQVIVYDGTCVFCARSAEWIAKRDPEGRFALHHLGLDSSGGAAARLWARRRGAWNDRAGARCGGVHPLRGGTADRGAIARPRRVARSLPAGPPADSRWGLPRGGARATPDRAGRRVLPRALSLA